LEKRWGPSEAVNGPCRNVHIREGGRHYRKRNQWASADHHQKKFREKAVKQRAKNFKGCCKKRIVNEEEGREVFFVRSNGPTTGSRGYREKKLK